jgi:hypothetical protein
LGAADSDSTEVPDDGEDTLRLVMLGEKAIDAAVESALSRPRQGPRVYARVASTVSEKALSRFTSRARVLARKVSEVPATAVLSASTEGLWIGGD